MNLKHDLAAPIGTLKMILAMLKDDGVLSERMERNADASFERIKDILERWTADQQNSGIQFED